jgi:hypothetical protein
MSLFHPLPAVPNEIIFLAGLTLIVLVYWVVWSRIVTEPIPKLLVPYVGTRQEFRDDAKSVLQKGYQKVKINGGNHRIGKFLTD